MNKLKKKSRLSTTNAKGDRKTFTVKIVTHEAEKIKCVVATKELNAYQKSAIRRVYCASHKRHSLVSNLKKLQFCTYSVALRYLKECEFIDNEDYYSLMQEV